MAKKVDIIEHSLSLPDYVEKEDQDLLKGFVQTTKASFFIKKLMRLAQSRSIISFPIVSGCCAIEFKSSYSSKYDMQDYYSYPDEHSPLQSDLLLIAGAITLKKLPVLVEIYNQMPGPKWVVLIGSCATSAGLFNEYNVIYDIAKYIPVDICIPGCPPTPEAMMHGMLLLQEKIKNVSKEFASEVAL